MIIVAAQTGTRARYRAKENSGGGEEWHDVVFWTYDPNRQSLVGMVRAHRPGERGFVSAEGPRFIDYNMPRDFTGALANVSALNSGCDVQVELSTGAKFVGRYRSITQVSESDQMLTFTADADGHGGVIQRAVRASAIVSINYRVAKEGNHFAQADFPGRHLHGAGVRGVSTPDQQRVTT